MLKSICGYCQIIFHLAKRQAGPVFEARRKAKRDHPSTFKTAFIHTLKKGLLQNKIYR